MKLFVLLPTALLLLAILPQDGRAQDEDEVFEYDPDHVWYTISDEETGAEDNKLSDCMKKCNAEKNPVKKLSCCDNGQMYKFPCKMKCHCKGKEVDKKHCMAKGSG